MSSEFNVKLTVVVYNPDLDAEEQERETRNLLQEIKDLDVESAELVAVAETPEGTKGLGGFLLGALQTEVSVANFKKVLKFLSDRLGSRTIELEVEANGKKLKVRANNQQELLTAVQVAEKFAAGKEIADG